MSLSRRDFVRTSAAAAAGMAVAGPTTAGAEVRRRSRSASLPAAVASANGIRGVQRAYEMMLAGEDPLDAAVAGVEIQELDPEDRGVGIGGLPNEQGVVQLDASCMHGPTRRAGAVGSLEGIATAARVAKAVMEYTDHIFLVGEGARRFALDLGFREQELLTEDTRQRWLRWRARLNPDDNWLDPREGRFDVDGGTGTVNLNAVTAAGDLASVTTTSGLGWKIPGRVGDSPIIGAGQYCDNTVGAAGSTGRGEANIMVCGSFLTVEFMRQGHTPEEAALRTLERVVDMTEDRLLDDRGRPTFNLNFYAIAKDGRFGAAAIYEGRRFAVANRDGARVEESAYLYRRD